MVKQGRSYSQEEIKCLKRNLLGLCGTEAVKTQDKFYEAVKKVVSPYSDDWANDLVVKTAVRLVELSGKGGLVYRVSTDAELFSGEPDNIFEHKLRIRKKENGHYHVYTSINQKSAWSPLSAF